MPAKRKGTGRRANAGSFKKGEPSRNPKGRPPKAVELSYLAAFKAGCSSEDLLAITLKAVEQARRGDRYAREWITKQAGTEAAQKIEQSLSVTTVTERRIRLETVTEETRRLASDLAVAIYSPVVHRDVKPENVGGYENGTNGAVAG
jgi:hypothetical protein